MNDALTPEELAELHGALEAKRADLEADILRLRHAEGAGSDFNSRADFVGDSGDNSVDLQELDQDRAEQDSLAYQLGEVKHALTKFETGTYGLCEECDGVIPLARLRVLPEARYDAQHQAEIEARRA